MITSDGKAMSTTPRTDEAARQGCYLTTGDYASTCGKQIVHINFARQLETELSEATAELAAIYATSSSEALAEANQTNLNLLKMLAESQAREAQLRETLKFIHDECDWEYSPDDGGDGRIGEACAMALNRPSEDAELSAFIARHTDLK